MKADIVVRILLSPEDARGICSEIDRVGSKVGSELSRLKTHLRELEQGESE